MGDFRRIVRILPASCMIGMLASGSPIQAQSWSGTGLLYANPTSTKIGIGLNNPTVPLDVLGRVLITGNVAGQEAMIVNQAASSGAILNLRQGSSSKLLVDYEGKVGIGVTPAAAVHIQRNAYSSPLLMVEGNSTGNNTLKALTLRHVNTPNAGNLGQAIDIDFSMEGPGAAMFPAGQIHAGKESDFTTTANLDSYLSFSTNRDGSFSEKLRLSSRGYVGIGTTNPQVKLEIAGAGTPEGSVRATSAFFELDGINAYAKDNGGTNNFRLGFGDDAKLLFNLEGKEVMSFRRGGGINFGKLSNLTPADFNFEANGDRNMPAGTYPTVTPFNFISWADDGPAVDNNVSLFQFSAGRIHPVYDANYRKATVFQVSNDRDNLFTIKGDGKIGIGTIAPSEMLEVAGNVKVSGSVQVDGIRTKTWTVAPDYVFEKDYKLKSLQEVESFVQKNKHLPEVPSAKTIAEKGLDLAEMNLLLLKKVEELTLHAIRQEKEMKRQAEEIRGLKSAHRH